MLNLSIQCVKDCKTIICTIYFNPAAISTNSTVNHGSILIRYCFSTRLRPPSPE